MMHPRSAELASAAWPQLSMAAQRRACAELMASNSSPLDPRGQQPAPLPLQALDLSWNGLGRCTASVDALVVLLRSPHTPVAELIGAGAGAGVGEGVGAGCVRHYDLSHNQIGRTDCERIVAAA